MTDRPRDATTDGLDWLLENTPDRGRISEEGSSSSGKVLVGGV